MMLSLILIFLTCHYLAADCPSRKCDRGMFQRRVWWLCQDASSHILLFCIWWFRLLSHEISLVTPGDFVLCCNKWQASIQVDFWNFVTQKCYEIISVTIVDFSILGHLEMLKSRCVLVALSVGNLVCLSVHRNAHVCMWLQLLEIGACWNLLLFTLIYHFMCNIISLLFVILIGLGLDDQSVDRQKINLLQEKLKDKSMTLLADKLIMKVIVNCSCRLHRGAIVVFIFIPYPSFFPNFVLVFFSAVGHIVCIECLE